MSRCFGNSELGISSAGDPPKKKKGFFEARRCLKMFQNYLTLGHMLVNLAQEFG